MGIPIGAPTLTVFLGPGRLQNIVVQIDSSTSSYSARGEVYVGAAQNGYIQTGGAVRADAITAIPTDPPIPVDAAVEGGMLLTLQGSEVGSIERDLNLAYSSGDISLDLNHTLQLGVILEADLDAYLNAQLYEIELCEFIWPLKHWEVSKAESYSLPISLSYSGGKASITIGPMAGGEIPVEDIETTLERFRPQTKCKEIKDVIEELCKRGILPKEICDELDSKAVTGLEGSCVANENLGEIADNFISRCCKGDMRREFPGELLAETLGSIKKGKTAKHKKAWKLLNEGRFKKPSASAIGPNNGLTPNSVDKSNRIRVQLQHKSDEVVPAEKREEDRSITVAEGHTAVDDLLNKTSKSVSKACDYAGKAMKKTISGYPPTGVDAKGNVARKWCNDHPDYERGIRLDLENLAGKNFTS
ncbi:MAG: hypothetical protein HOP34_15700 [Methylococcaceae bacterium]|nr:hypothetical protein [Methylococcaceae bacterium]